MPPSYGKNKVMGPLADGVVSNVADDEELEVVVGDSGEVARGWTFLRRLKRPLRGAGAGSGCAPGPARTCNKRCVRVENGVFGVWSVVCGAR